MKKTKALLFLAPLLSCFVVSATSFAATQTKILKPIDAKLGKAYVYNDNSTIPNIISGGGGTDLSNILAEDGQFVLFDPQLPGPGDYPASTIMMIDYEKNAICSGATIQGVTVHSTWRSSEAKTQPSDLAVVGEVDFDNGVPNISVRINSSTGAIQYLNNIFGGLLISMNMSNGQPFSGIVPTTLTQSSAPTQTLMTNNDINDPSSRIIVSMGQGGLGDVINISGYLDYVYLEVTYDDSNCVPQTIANSTVKPPKTGSVLTISIIIAAVIAATSASIFGVKRTKLKHRVSERE